MPSLILSIADHLGCTPDQLQARMTHPMTLERVSDFLSGRKLKLMYKPGGYIRFDGWSFDDAAKTPAYNGVLGITVQQHFSPSARFI